MQEGIKMAYMLTIIKEYGCSKITITPYCVYKPVYVKQVETITSRIARSKELIFCKLLKLFVYDRLYMVGYINQGYTL